MPRFRLKNILLLLGTFNAIVSAAPAAKVREISNFIGRFRVNELEDDKETLRYPAKSYVSRINPDVFPYLSKYKMGVITSVYRLLSKKGTYVKGLSLFYVNPNPRVSKTLVILPGINGLIGRGSFNAPDNFEELVKYASTSGYNLLLVDLFGYNVNFANLRLASVKSLVSIVQEGVRSFSSVSEGIQVAKSNMNQLARNPDMFYLRGTSVIDKYLEVLQAAKPGIEPKLEVMGASFSGIIMQKLIKDPHYSSMMCGCTFLAPLLLDSSVTYSKRNFSIAFVNTYPDPILSIAPVFLRGTALNAEMSKYSKIASKVQIITIFPVGHADICCLINRADFITYILNARRNFYE